MNKDVIRKVYDAMSKEYDMAEDFDTFAQDIQNKDVARRVYDAMYDRYRMEEDFEEFYKDLTFMPSVEGVKTTESGSVVVDKAPKQGRITLADTLNASVPGMVSSGYTEEVKEEQEKNMLTQEERDQRAAIRQRLQEDGTIDRMKESRKEARREKLRAFGSMLGSTPQVTSFGVSTNVFDSTDEQLADVGQALDAGTEYRQNKLLQEKLDVALDMARAGENQDGLRGVENFGLGLWDSATRLSTWDFGASDIVNNLTLQQIVEKWENDPSSLTATEQKVLEGIGMATAVQEAYADKVGVGYAVGESLPQSLGFMASMHLNPASGLGKAAMAKAATKYGQQSVKKYVARALGDVAETAIMTATTGGGRVVADAIDRINGQSTYEIDDNGMVLYGGQKDQETVGDAIWKAIGSNFIENYTEALGEYFDPIMGVAKGVVGGGLRKVNLNKFADWLTDAKPSETASAIRAFREKAKFGGLFGEVMEEELGMAMNALFVGDNNFGSPDDPNSIFNPETQLTTILSCAIMTGVLNGAESIGNRGTRKKYENNLSATERAAQQSLGDKFTEIKGALDTATPEQMVDILNGVLTDQSYDLQQKRLLTEYAVARVGMQYYNTTEEEGRKQLTDAQRNIVDAYEAGRHAQLPQFYGINNAVMTAEQTINQMPHAEELWSVIELLDRAPINEHEQIMRDLTDGDRHLVNDYRANRSRMEGVVEGRAEQVENLVQEYADKMGKHAYQKADGTREVATGIVGDEVVFIDDINEFGDAFVHTTDGNRFGLKIKDISHLQVRKLDDMVNEFRQSTTTAVDNETQKNLEYPVEVQEPAQGVTVSTLDGKQWQVAQTDGETVELVGMLFDKKSGQWIPNSGDYRKMTRKQFMDWQKAEIDRKKANTYEQGDELTFYVGGGEPISAEITGITPEGKYLVQIDHLVDGLNKSVVDEYTADELRNLTTYSNNVSANQPQNEGTPTEEIKQSVSKEVTDGQTEENASEPIAEVVESVNTPQTKAAELLAELEADEVDENIVYNTQKVIDLAEEKRKAKPTMKDADGDVATFKALKAQWQAELEDAQRNVLFWNNVAKEVANARVASQTVVPEVEAEAEQPAVVQPMDMSPQPAKKAKKSRKREPVSFDGLSPESMAIANGIMADMAPQNGVELAAAMMSTGGKRIIPESFRKHTGYSTTEQKSFLGLIAGADKGGLTIEHLGELVMQADREDGTNFFDQNDANAGLNAVLEVLGQSETIGDVNDYIKRNREEAAYREAWANENAMLEAEQEAKDAWYMEQYHATEEELAAYSEYLAEITEEIIADDANYEERFNTFAELIADEYDNQGTDADIRSSADQGERLASDREGSSSVGEGEETDRQGAVLGDATRFAEAEDGRAGSSVSAESDVDGKRKVTANVFEMAEEAQKKRKQDELKAKAEAVRDKLAELGFTNGATLPKGYKWSDGKKYGSKGETITVLVVGDDIYLRDNQKTGGFIPPFNINDKNHQNAVIKDFRQWPSYSHFVTELLDAGWEGGRVFEDAIANTFKNEGIAISGNRVTRPLETKYYGQEDGTILEGSNQEGGSRRGGVDDNLHGGEQTEVQKSSSDNRGGDNRSFGTAQARDTEGMVASASYSRRVAIDSTPLRDLRARIRDIQRQIYIAGITEDVDAEYVNNLKEDLEYAKEVLAKKEGNKWGVEDLRPVSLETAEAMFNEWNDDADVKALFDRVFDVFKKFGIDIKFDDAYKHDNKKAFFDAADNHIVLPMHLTYEEYVPQQEKATILLHEMIHGVTQYVLHAVEMTPESRREKGINISKGMLEAANQLHSIYNYISVGGVYKDVNGMQDVHEMVSQLADPNFRAFLKEQSLWDKIVEAIQKLLGIPVENNALDTSAKLLDYILDNYDIEAYNKLAGRINRTYYSQSSDENLRFREKEDNQDAAYMDAVKRGDMETAQRMVDEAARKAMKKTKVVDKDKQPMLMSHHTDAEGFYVFDRGKIGTGQGQAFLGAGFNFSRGSGSSVYGSRNIQAYLDARKPLRSDRNTLSIYQIEQIIKELNAINGDNVEYNFADNVSRAARAIYEYGGDLDTYASLCTAYSGETRDVLEVFEKLGFDSTIEYGDDKRIMNAVVFNSNQIKSADPVTYDDNGNVIPLSERFNLKEEDIRFRDGAPFFSNAERAVENIKQQKATPEQWLAMIKKDGGLKAGEDKWMGLSDWLNEQKTQGVKTLTKDEVLAFIRENQIGIEEVEYADIENNSRFKELNDEYRELYYEYDHNGDAAFEEMVSRYGDDFELAFSHFGDELVVEDTFGSEAAEYFLGVRSIDVTRRGYTTDGLDNKHEIALVVPTIDSWNQSDIIHFGDAGEGRAVAWVRFGETIDEDGKRVLVIDEVQSKRHDEGRAKGYQSKEKGDLLAERNRLYDKMYRDGLTEEEFNRRNEINARLEELGEGQIPDAPFDKNYHELVMKRMLRYAAENGFDKVAWTKGAQQAQRYNLNKVFDSVEREDNPSLQGKRFVLSGANTETIQVGDDGVVVDATIADAKGKTLESVVGVDMAKQMMSLENGDMIEGQDFAIGGEGMKGFYDEMIPRFMNKYTKKWGTKVGEVTLPNVEEAGRTMWSVDVTPEMRESVMQGQPMFREGMGAISDREVSYENDPIAKFQGKPRYYGKRAAAFAERERRRMENAAKEAAEMLGIEAEIITDASTLQGRKAKAKGWYDIINKKVVVVVPNHVSMGDAVRTVLHEGIAHHGLRELFGDGFDAMLDNVYNNVAPELKERIDAIAERTGVSTSVATEEYLAGLAETTNFEEAQRRGWWQKIKSYFVDMLRKLSIPGLKLKEEITDNELRYLLWRSYKNLVEPNSYLKPLGYLDDVAKQKELKVGEYSDNKHAAPRAAEMSEAEEWAAVTMQRIEELEVQAAQLENEIAEMEADRDADDASRYEIWEQQLEPLRKQMEDVYAELEGLYSLEAEAEEMSMASEDAIRYRLVDDPAEIERLESEPTIKAYRAMQVINGELYPPMSAVVDGKLREPIALGQWEQSEERPDLADDNGRFKLDKGNKKGLKAAYNPYFHSSATPLNDQFAEAQDRPNLVTVEVEVPVSEVDGTSGYKAEKAKDAVGTHQWKAGIIQGQLTGTREVFLTRWDKPIRIVHESEVADVIVEMFDGKDIVMPSNVVTPQLRKELEARGIAFVETDNQGKLVEGEHKGEHYSKVYGKKAKNGLRYREDSVSLRHISNQEASTIADMISDCFYDDVTQADRIAMVEYLQQSEDGREVIDRLYEHRGSGWARQAVNATMVRISLHDLINGREPSVQSMLTRGAEHKVVSYIRRMGAEGVWRYLEEKDFLSEAAKPLTNVNGSFLSCNPSAECAKYCYATKGHYTYAGSTVKSELVYWAVDADPNRAADRIYREYQALRESAQSKALRLFDKGDLDEAWLPVIEELNRRGIVTQIFSKRSEVLQRVDDTQNVVMLSIDHSNADMLEQYPTMPIAFVYRGRQDMELLEQCKERFLQHGGVILPVKVGQKLLSKEELEALPSWTRPYQCPIDNGTKQIVNKENPERSWNCTKCDRNGGVGCFFKRTAKQLKDNRNESKRDGLVSRTDRDGERASARNEEGGIGRTSALHDTNGGLGDSEIRGGILQTLRDGGIPDAYITPELVEALAGRIRGWNENGTRGRNIGGAESVDAQSPSDFGREGGKRDRLKRTSRIDRNSEEIIAEVERESAALGVSVRIARSVDELPDADTRKRAVDGKLKGYFDPRTNEVVLYEPNTNDANDAKRTILHEIVGHKGLRQLIGEQRYDKAMLQLMYMLPADVRDAVLRRAERHGWNAAIAMDEYLAEQAERDVQPTWWGKVNAKIRALLRNMGFNVMLTDADVTYLLWRSRKKLQGDDLNDMAVNAILKQAARKSVNYDVESDNSIRHRGVEQGKKISEAVSDYYEKYTATTNADKFWGGVKYMATHLGDGGTRALLNDLSESQFEDIRSVRVLEEAIESAEGKPLRENEMVHKSLNAKTSRDARDMDKSQTRYFQPMAKLLGKILGKKIDGRKIEIDDVERYLICKHSPENNEFLMKRAHAENRRKKIHERAKELMKGTMTEEEAIAQATSEYTLHQSDFRDDYSGLTELFPDDMVREAKIADRTKELTSNGVDKVTARQMASREFESYEPTLEDREKMAADEVARFEAAVDGMHEELWGIINGINRDTIERLFRSGLISRSLYNDLKKRHKFYVPLSGWKNDAAADIYNYAMYGFDGTPIQTVIKKAFGTKYQARNILGSMFAMNMAAITEGNQNLVKQKLYNLALNHDTGVLQIVDLWEVKDGEGDAAEWKPAPKPELRPTMSDAEMQTALTDYQNKLMEMERDGKARKAVNSLADNFGKHTTDKEAKRHHVELLVNGRKVVIWVNGNPKLAQAINGDLKVKKELLFFDGAVDKANRFLAQVQTSLNPEFMISNFERDILSASRYNLIKYGPKYEASFMKHLAQLMPIVSETNADMRSDVWGGAGIFNLFALDRNTNNPNRKPDAQVLDMNNPLHREFVNFLNYGGKTGYVERKQAEDLQQRIKKLSKREQSIIRKVPAEIAGWAVDTIEHLNEGIENATRFAAYLTARERGKSVTEAVFEAKEVSVNFNMQGSGAWGNASYRKLYNYFNVGLQSLRREKNLGREYPKAYIANLAFMMALGAISTVLLTADWDGDDEDEYMGLSDFNRYNYINVKTENGFIHYSLPQDLRAFYAIGCISTEWAMGKIDGSRAVQAYATQANNYTPLSFVSTTIDREPDSSPLKNLAMSFVPSAAVPVAEIAVNEDFLGRRIHNQNQWNEYEPEWQRAGYRTPEWVINASKTLSKVGGGTEHKRGVWFTEINPSNAWHIMDSYGGGFLDFAQKTYNLVERELTGEEHELRDYPMVSKFYVESGQDYSKQRVVNDRYRMYREDYETISNELNGYLKDKNNALAKLKVRAAEDNMSKLSVDMEAAAIEKVYSENVERIKNSPNYWIYESFEPYEKGYNTLDRNLDKARKSGSEQKEKEFSGAMYDVRKKLVEEIDAKRDRWIDRVRQYLGS